MRRLRPVIHSGVLLIGVMTVPVPFGECGIDRVGTPVCRTVTCGGRGMERTGVTNEHMHLVGLLWRDLFRW